MQMQIYDKRLVTIQMKRIRDCVVNMKLEHMNVDFTSLNDRLDFLEDLLHLHDDREIEVINITRAKAQEGGKL